MKQALCKADRVRRQHRGQIIKIFAAVFLIGGLVMAILAITK